MFEAIAARLPRVLKLEDPVFGEVADDEKGTAQAVVVTALAAAIGNLTAEGNIIGNIVVAIIVAPVGLFIWTGIVFVVGKMFGGQGTYMQLLRPIGYSGATFALGIVPVIGGLAGLVYGAIIQVKAVVNVNKVSQGSAIATVILPMVVFFIGIVILAVLASIALFAGLDAIAD